MFYKALNRIGCSCLSIPLFILKDQNNQLVSSVGFAISTSSIGNLSKLGLFNHKFAEILSKNIFESVGKTLTGHWMDATGQFTNFYPEAVSVGLHRGVHGHHFITDAIRTVRSDHLSVIDFYNHLATDIVTKNGIPILPEELIKSIADFFDISLSKVIPWSSINILDAGTSFLAIGHAGSNTVQIMNSEAKWGVGYALDTLGIGSLEVISGVGTTNSFLIGAGAVDIACGAVTLVDYLNKPKVLGVPVEDIISSGLVGAGISTLLSSILLIPQWNKTSKNEKLLTLAKNLGEGGLLSCLSAVSLPMSLTWSLGMTGFNISKSMADSSKNLIKAMPLTSKFSHDLDLAICDSFVSREIMDSMRKIASGNSYD